MVRRKRLGTVGALVALCAVAAAALLARGGFASLQRGAGLPSSLAPAALGRVFFGPRFSRAEIVVQERGSAHDLRLDRGRAVSVAGGSIDLRERDGTTVTVPVSPTAQVRFRGRAGTLAQIPTGSTVLTIRDDSAPASVVQVVARA